ncbi:proline-rich protein PRCC [Diachasma alloeum]|uniref:proline-rich protein PRCC n=1 Tax=Diachasma alloeum TaxID=454923 RepID=UPI000738367E|nr:proline-rich protein PRCC [Diachasma alloeum]
MSLGGLVAYGSSDESEDEVTSDEQNPSDTPKIITNNGRQSRVSEQPLPEVVDKIQGKESRGDESLPEPSLFNSLPKPRSCRATLEEDDEVPVTRSPQMPTELPQKREKAPVKFLVPSLSDFKDVDEEMEERKTRKQPSSSGSGLFSMLPAPGASLPSAKNLVPHVLRKSENPGPPLTPSQLRKPVKKPEPVKASALNSLKYDSNSEDEEDERHSVPQKNPDFFSLSKSVEIPVPEEAMASLMLPPPPERDSPQNSSKTPPEMSPRAEETQTLRSTVMNLPRDEILLKNQAEVGPKLPVPEQEYHLDAEGNVAFDEKAIEYLCGKRGIKRKNELIQGTNIIDISGDDIKPDEREWLVKALTEEPVQRTVSLSSAGPSSASKKKHQITYLAHQAKAMEIELQNQWAANRMARKQTKSKYGF